MPISPSQLKDEPLHQGARERLVKILTDKGISDRNVLQAIGKVKRHVFFNTTFRSRSYEDIAFPIAAGQTISQPYTVAKQTELLEIKSGDKVLEIGTGSGYQTCVLLEIGAKVFTIERQKELYDITKTLLPQMGYSPKMFYGDGYIGLEAYAPFDKVIVTAGAPFIPEPLKKQLRVGGKLVIPVGQGDVQEMLLIDKISEDNYQESRHGAFRFVPMLTQKNK